jgi:ribosome modulation factor
MSEKSVAAKQKKQKRSSFITGWRDKLNTLMDAVSQKQTK